MNSDLWPDLRRTFYRTCVVIATLGAGYLLYRLGELVVVLFLSLIFASTVRPLIARLKQWNIPTSVAIALIYGATILGFIFLIVVAVPPVIQLAMEMSQGNQIVSDLNFALLRTSFLLRQQFQLFVPILELPPQLEELLASADEAMAEQAVPFATTAISMGGSILLAIVLSIYWLVARRTALRQILMLTPKSYRSPVYRIWVDTEDSLGRYLRGMFLLAVIIGAVSYVGLLVLRVPNARALAVLAGMFEFIPFVGPVLAAVPAIFLAINVSPVTAVLVLLLYVVIQTVEGNYLVPKIMGRGLQLHPMIVLLAITAGFYLGGVVGAILALPLAGALQIAARHLGEIRAADGEETDETAQARDADPQQLAQSATGVVEES